MMAMAMGDCGERAMPSVMASGRSTGPVRTARAAPRSLPPTRERTKTGTSTQPCHAVGSQSAPTTSRKMR